MFLETCSLDVPGLDFSNPGTKENTVTKEQVQEQVCFLPPYVIYMPTDQYGIGKYYLILRHIKLK